MTGSEDELSVAAYLLPPDAQETTELEEVSSTISYLQRCSLGEAFSSQFALDSTKPTHVLRRKGAGVPIMIRGGGVAIQPSRQRSSVTTHPSDTRTFLVGTTCLPNVDMKCLTRGCHRMQSGHVREMYVQDEPEKVKLLHVSKEDEDESEAGRSMTNELTMTRAANTQMTSCRPSQGGSLLLHCLSP